MEGKNELKLASLKNIFIFVKPKTQYSWSNTQPLDTSWSLHPVQNTCVINWYKVFGFSGLFNTRGVIAWWIKRLLCNLCFDGPGVNPTLSAIVFHEFASTTTKKAHGIITLVIKLIRGPTGFPPLHNLFSCMKNFPLSSQRPLHIRVYLIVLLGTFHVFIQTQSLHATY